MHDFPIIINITIALLVALIGGLIARHIKLPTIVGYLLAGVAIGPFTPGFVGDLHTIQQLAELGVIFLLFGVGLHFSLRDLWSVRDIAIGGALAQMLLATLAVVGLTSLWGWSLTAGLVVGLAVSIASTVVLLRNLTDHGLLSTSHGQVAVGWLVLEDLMTVLILVLLPAFFGGTNQSIWQAAGIAILKAAIFVVVTLVVGVRFIPWLLLHIAGLRSRELFIVTIVVLTLGIAVSAATFFGVSLALGAFLAGVVVHESSLSHQIEIEIQPFRETFAILFFVSVGMLVNPSMIMTHPWEALALTAIIIGGKALIVFFLGFFFRRPARTIIVIAVALSQIGEFSFLLGQTGLDLHLITQHQYSLVLMGALISITVNPLIFYLIPQIEKTLERIPPIWKFLNRYEPVPEPIPRGLRDHVVLIGYGRVGRRIADTLSTLNIPLLVIELDASILTELKERGIPTLFGDAANSDILNLAHLEEARAVVVAVPNDTTLVSIAATVRHIAPDIVLLTRAADEENVRRLFELKANAVIYPEIEGGLQLLDETLLYLGYPEPQVERYSAAIREDRYNLEVTTEAEKEALADILAHAPPRKKMPGTTNRSIS